jgi:L-alanine-DL-glutamate epimerase-like enolase superfamily enzyme
MIPSPLHLRVRTETWPLAKAFTISRGAKTEAHVVVAELTDGCHTGRGECVPYPRYGETVEEVATAIEALREAIADGLDRLGLQQALPAGAARNALDCAFWDLEAKRSKRPAHELAGIPTLRPLRTAYTISLGTPEAMAEAAGKAAATWPLLKIKLGADGDPARLAAVRRAAPAAELIVDANEGWTAENLAENLAACARYGVTLVEQPLPAAQDDALATIPHPVPVCADESAHDSGSLARLAGKYDAVNVKLDKTGGLTEALAMADRALQMGFFLMAGCMVSTSLAIAPALLIAQKARVVDLDGPLLLAKDRPHGLRYKDGLVYPAVAELWG